MKTIIVACGSGIATSTILNAKLEELLKRHGIDHRLIQCSLNELDSYLSEADLIVSSMQIMRELPVPKLLGIAYLTGIGEEELNRKIIESLLK
ncbi:PTS system galactitol-specific EIIB component [bioreactor metagenome]|uniref:PTS system galactitol-specific EIIB component n=1 Tax=bioreactor metagenome TaxID=1076179 RepID=A0A645DB72_9ZZZZ|nr:PTS sugar transporter subunit IIB [Erysipelotrichaceae bacterium]